MIWINLVSIGVALAVMARASMLFRESSMLPAPMNGALQIVGVLSIMVLTLGIVLLSASEFS